jgi:nucleotide-binding universal stress UspA family protein
VAVDGSESAGHALDALTRLPLPAELELKVVHVLRPDLPLMVPLISQEMIEQHDREARASGERIVEHARERLRAAGRGATTDVRVGVPADEVITAAQEARADLLVVGAANRSAVGRLLLGSVSGRVLSHAPCSVLVARSAGG